MTGIIAPPVEIVATAGTLIETTETMDATRGARTAMIDAEICIVTSQPECMQNTTCTIAQRLELTPTKRVKQQRARGRMPRRLTVGNRQQ